MNKTFSCHMTLYEMVSFMQIYVIVTSTLIKVVFRKTRQLLPFDHALVYSPANTKASKRRLSSIQSAPLVPAVTTAQLMENANIQLLQIHTPMN